MMDKIPEQLEEHLETIIQWVEDTAETQGRTLTDEEMRWAKLVRVKHPEKINVVSVAQMPTLPESVRHISDQHLDTSGAAGLTLGYTVFVLNGHYCRQLMQHEFRHVYQTEHLTVKGFMIQYIQDIMKFGYVDSPLEEDARIWEHERGDNSSEPSYWKKLKLFVLGK